MNLLTYARRIDLAIAAEEDPRRADALLAYQRELERLIQLEADCPERERVGV